MCYPFEEVRTSENDKVHKKKRKATPTFNVPDNDGTKARPVTPNKGLSNERGQVRILRELSNLTNQDARAWTQTVQQMSQLADPDSPDLCNLSENLLKESGLSPHAANYGDWGERAKLQRTPPKSLPQPTFTPFSISDGAVKARTGFVSMFSLLSFVVVVCNGDVVQMMKKKSSMTWFEEWFLFFQWEWGRESTTLTLLLDFFKMSESTIRRVLRHKLNAVLEARKRWPRFATLEEDVTLMSAWWQNKYGTKRVILWDDTNINIPAASDSHLNRHTYSAYYAGNVAKGAVFLQLCGWMGTWELWAGAILDTEYQTRSGVFKYMQWFVDDFD